MSTASFRRKYWLMGGVLAALVLAGVLLVQHRPASSRVVISPVQAVEVRTSDSIRVQHTEVDVDQATLNFVLGAVVLIVLGVALYEAGRARGEAGILKRLQEVNSNKPTLDAIEGLVQSVPGQFVEKILGTIVQGMLAARPFLPAQAINDELRKALTTVSDGLPNEVSTPGTATVDLTKWPPSAPAQTTVVVGDPPAPTINVTSSAGNSGAASG